MMTAKQRNRASLDADAVARMMREQDEPAEPTSLPVVGETTPAPIAPAVQPPATVDAEVIPPLFSNTSALDPGASTFDPGRVDGRTLRRTNREPFATRIKPEAHAALKRIAYARGTTIAEALELAVAAFEGAKNQSER